MDPNAESMLWSRLAQHTREVMADRLARPTLAIA